MKNLIIICLIVFILFILFRKNNTIKENWQSCHLATRKGITKKYCYHRKCGDYKHENACMAQAINGCKWIIDKNNQYCNQVFY